VRRDRDRDGGVDPRELLDRDRVRNRVAAGAPVLLGYREPHQAELSELRDELVREPAREVELRCDGLDTLPGERSDGIADQLLLGSEVEVHGARSVAAR